MYPKKNGYESGLATINYGVPQRSVPGPLPLLLYVNDLNRAIKFCKIHHFADGTNLLRLSNPINPLSANATKWSNNLKQFVGNLPTNCWSV